MELLALAAVGIHPAVVHPPADHLDPPDPGCKLAGWGVTVAAHQPVATLIDQLGEGGQVKVDLGSSAAASMRRAPSRASSSRLIASSLRAASSVTTLNMSRRSFLAGGGAPASFQPGQGGRYAAFSCQGLIHRFRRYLGEVGPAL